MVEGMESVIQKEHYNLKVLNFYEKRDNLEHYLEDLRTTDCVGILLFGTEMREEVVRPFLQLPFPVVILDAYFEGLDCTYVLPNNRQGAYLATDYLISRRLKQPPIHFEIFRSVRRAFTGLFKIMVCLVLAVLFISYRLQLTVPWQICLLSLTAQTRLQTAILQTTI